MVEYDSVVALYTHLYPYTYPIYTPTPLLPTIGTLPWKGGCIPLEGIGDILV